MLGYLLAALALAVLLAALSGWLLRRGRRGRSRSGVIRGLVGSLSGSLSGVLSGILAGAAAGACGGFAVGLLASIASGQPEPAREAWAPGVVWARQVSDRPGEGPVVMHVVEVDLAVARPRFGLWPEPEHEGGTAFENQVGRLFVTTGREAARATGADLVLNASHFGPIYGDLLFFSYPRRGEPVRPVGELVSHGRPAGLPQPTWPMTFFEPGGAVKLGAAAGEARADEVGFAGRSVLVRDGRATPRGGHLAEIRYPRCALGVDETGGRLWLVVVDGKQPGRSVGLTLAALAERLVELGAHEALELDGGGSAQLTRRGADGHALVVNSPCHQKLPGWERPVANHLVMHFESGPAPSE